MMILNRIRESEIGSSGLGKVPVAWFCEGGNEFSNSIKCPTLRPLFPSNAIRYAADRDITN
jgi:hypothetical protein